MDANAEQSQAMQYTHKLFALYVLFFAGATFANKYVLSILQFQFPTIFQGWQTLVGALVLWGLSQNKQVELDVMSINRSLIAVWLPGMMLFTLSIYSGSVALSQLPVPTFLSITNVITVFPALAEVALHRKLTSVKRYVLLLVIWVSVFMLSWTDPHYTKNGYMWVTVHVICIGVMNLYQRIFKNLILLGELQQVYCNYVYSMVVLAPSSYFLGEAMAAQRFQFWYYYKFYVGCIVSGLCGACLSVCLVKVKQLPMEDFCPDQLIACAKAITSAISLVFFPITLTASNVFWLLVNLIASMLLPDRNAPVPVISIDSLTTRLHLNVKSKDSELHLPNLDDT